MSQNRRLAPIYVSDPEIAELIANRILTFEPSQLRRNPTLPSTMQKLLSLLGLIGLFTTNIAAASTGPRTENSVLNLLENDMLAGETSNKTLYLSPNDFSSLNASAALLEITCRSSVPSTHYARILVGDYYEAVDQILTRVDAMIPKQWVLGRDVSHQLTWRSGTCSVLFCARTLTITQSFPIILAAHMAALVVKQCVTEATGYRGGWAQLNILGAPTLIVTGV